MKTIELQAGIAEDVFVRLGCVDKDVICRRLAALVTELTSCNREVSKAARERVLDWQLRGADVIRTKQYYWDDRM